MKVFPGNSLSYKQIEIIAKKISRARDILSKLRYYAFKKTLTSIYYSLFQSYVLYGSTVWSFMSQKNTKENFVLQKKCMKLLTFSDYSEHGSPIFKSLKVLKLQDIIQFTILKAIYFYTSKKVSKKVNFNLYISAFSLE